ncbi:STAS-like domain-containing protein [Roseomonas marmotae]|uniref:STAS-like domain-containing protein n=1 Tax=Roseomonas marmotae TaxID=2768161 RepID=UPI001AD6107A|nr:STAS-like domain-containing protein [Roseomonas marmotae]QTI79026.1 STAS-like domain-containing protein [Roseomonas marmotae]
MVITVIDHAPNCQTYADGLIIAQLISDSLRRGEMVTLSFRGVYAVPSSFVNAAFVSLLNSYPADVIRRLVKITDSTRQINALIKERVAKEAELLRPLCA